jgi:CheY-like chemotaxis protein
MTDDLLALRAILLSGSRHDRDLFRQAAAATQVPIEIVEADNAEAASAALAGGADLVFVDGGCPSAEIAQVAAAARSAAKPPFLILLAPRGAGGAPLVTDGVAAKPMRLDEARQFVERAIRLRIPNRVLVVDDSSTMRSIVRKILAATRFPFEVTEAAEGLAALKLVSENEFDIVILDYNMPDFSGLETLAEFRRERRHMTVVVITSAQEDGLAERVRAEGAAFLRKPFYPADIEAALTGHYGLTALNPQRA